MYKLGKNLSKCFCRVLNESQNKYIDFSFIRKQSPQPISSVLNFLIR